MKKMICMLLVLVMLGMLLAGCGGKEPPGGTVIPEASGDTEPTGIVEPETTEPTTEAAESTAESTESATEPTEEESNLSMGRLEGGTYVNEYAGFACKLDPSWQFYTAQELQELPEQISEATKGSELNEYLSGVTQFTDMMAENVTELTAVNVVYQKLNMEQRLAYQAISEEQLIDALVQEAQLLEEFYAAAGITVHSMEKVKVTFLGQEHYAVYCVCDIQGVAYYTLQLCNGKLGEYSVTLTLASYVEDKTASLLDLFTPLE